MSSVSPVNTGRISWASRAVGSFSMFCGSTLGDSRRVPCRVFFMRLFCGLFFWNLEEWDGDTKNGKARKYLINGRIDEEKERGGRGERG